MKEFATLGQVFAFHKRPHTKSGVCCTTRVLKLCLGLNKGVANYIWINMCLWHILHDDIPFVQYKDLLQCNVTLNGIRLIWYIIGCATNLQSSYSDLTFEISLLLKTTSFLKCNYSCLHFFMNTDLTLIELFMKLIQTGLHIHAHANVKIHKR